MIPPIIKMRHPSKRAFTLVEVLVVASIIAVLCSLGLVGLNSMKRKADLTRCASNLRQIGTGIFLYAAENDSVLPGPGYAATGAKDEIAIAIAPYVGGSNTAARLFSCPAWLNAPDYSGSKKPYYCGKTVLLKDGTTVYPFGYKRTPASSSDAPTRLVNIQTVSEAVALIDLDSSLTSNSGAVAAPPHEKFRNALYFDGHVQTLSITNK